MVENNIRIVVDGDACPVKDEIYKVAYRVGVAVLLVSNSPFRIPRHDLITLKLVSDAFDAADDYIADTVTARDVVVTTDILLAERCLKAGARVLSPRGDAFTDDNIGRQVAARALMADLRAGAVGDPVGGPKAFTKADRSTFLQALDREIVRLKRG